LSLAKTAHSTSLLAAGIGTALDTVCGCIQGFILPLLNTDKKSLTSTFLAGERTSHQLGKMLNFNDKIDSTYLSYPESYPDCWVLSLRSLWVNWCEYLENGPRRPGKLGGVGLYLLAYSW